MAIRTVNVDGPILLRFPGGLQVRVEPSGIAGPPSRRGRKPSAATQAIIDAMVRDKAAGERRDRAEYLAMLRKAGHKSSQAAASAIVGRETRRIFGRVKARGPRGAKRDGRGRPLLPETASLRAKLAEDQAAGGLRDVAHYVRWLVDKHKIGLKKARPLVYRELRAAK